MTTKEKAEVLQIVLNGGKEAELLLLEKIRDVRKKMDEAHKGFEQELQDIFKLATDDSKLKDLLERIEEVKKMEGPVGAKGDKGDSVVGPKGDSGKDGKDSTVPGPRCERGFPGEDGYTPKKGIDYFDGKDGKSPDPQPIEDFKEELDKLREDVKKIDRSRPMFGGGRMARFERFSFTGDGVLTSFTLPHVPAGKGLAIWVYYQ